MYLRNISQYPTDEVRRLVALATAPIDMRRVCVEVKNLRHARFAGHAYDGVPYINAVPATAEYLITIGLGAPEWFPVEHQHTKRSPVFTFGCWREALVGMAAHEALHIEQYQEGLPASEVACEHFAQRMLNQYRQHTGAAS